MIKGIIILPRKAVRDSIISLGRSILKRKFIADPVKKVLRRFPRLFGRLHRMVNSTAAPIVPDQRIIKVKGYDQLSPGAKKIYYCMQELEKKK